MYYGAERKRTKGKIAIPWRFLSLTSSLIIIAINYEIVQGTMDTKVYALFRFAILIISRWKMHLPCGVVLHGKLKKQMFSS